AFRTESDRHLALRPIVLDAFNEEPHEPKMLCRRRPLRLCVPRIGTKTETLDLFQHQPFDRLCGDRLRRTDLAAVPMGSAAEVVTVALPAAHGVGWGHGAAARRAAQQPLQQGTELVPCRSAPRPALLLELVLHLLPDVSRDDSRLLAVVELVLVVDFA